MTEIAGELETLETILDRVSAFDTRPDIGNAVGLLDRLARYFSGDPVSYAAPTSATFTAPATLPDEPRARLAVVQVVTNSIFYRLDGSVPNSNNEQQAAPGTILYLTGQPSIKGFIFISTTISLARVAVTYFD